jgi:hypothetical protein
VESLSTVGGGAVARYRGIYPFSPGAYITTLDTTAAGFATNKGACTVNGVSYAAGTATGCDEADIQRDADFTYKLYQRNFYVQDSIKKGRATINLGLRFDHQHDLATPWHGASESLAARATARDQFSWCRFGRPL